ncbi:MAG: hypothetical protein COX77_02310 [Candidatus Komeilibacteria bacterium CG_4_10_14_0_2_um_filter_37_10]|uniref:Peptidase C39-like domain-containing protein n=1 Tax=Candidatus Komeilibacteria bacterium CG_4_10_14_0_2_um_filter_37_10 TaxID=1974470 RepID=A0A2M7VF29_9BACT|nr:MAG: hypothetical protein COX77_02310 [Candidatus Komeilibacteria bacterium CG_4_10_14_0_2_um_filter_37_10]
MQSKLIIIILILVSGLLVNEIIYGSVLAVKKSLPPEKTWQEIQSLPLVTPNKEVVSNNATTPIKSLPQQVNLAVPFLVQAPDGNWQLPYQESCEEAAMLMAYYYWQGKKQNPTKQEANNDILKLVDWQNKNKGDYRDTTISQVATIVQEYWHYQTEILERPTVKQLKKYLDNGYPIIAPFYGRALKNPYFRDAGPLYHMLVLKGYQDDKFITNDPGTRRGQDYVYTMTVIMSALHDWNSGDVLSGEPRVLIIKKTSR